MLGKIYEIISKFTGGERLNINYLNESEPSYAIRPVSDVAVRKYLDDAELRKFTFDLWYITFYGDDSNVNMSTIEKMNSLARKIESHEEESFSFFAAEVETPPVLVSESVSLAKYRLRMTVTYAM